MKPIKLHTCSNLRAEIQLQPGGRPYLGVSLKIGTTDVWLYIQDRDLYRLERAVQKCKKAGKSALKAEKGKL